MSMTKEIYNGIRVNVVHDDTLPKRASIKQHILIAVLTAVVLLLGVGLASLFSTAFGS